MREEAVEEDVGYPMRVASRRSGLKQDTIRAWERRYGALEPRRSEGGHRLYSEGDIERLRLLRRATEAGHSIGRIARLGGPELRALLEADAEDRGAGWKGVSSDPRLMACLAAVEDLDAPRLEGELETAAVELSRQELFDRLLAPLVEAIGEGFDRGRLRPAHEHLASAVIEGFVHSFRSAFAVPSSAPLLVTATPAQQHHELGATLAGAVAASEGWRVVYLGANLPAEEIVAGGHLKSATAVALSIVFPPDDPHLDDELRRLRRVLDPSVALIVGGRAAADYRVTLDEIGAIVVEDFAQFRRVLGDLRRRRKATGG